MSLTGYYKFVYGGYTDKPYVINCNNKTIYHYDDKWNDVTTVNKEIKTRGDGKFESMFKSLGWWEKRGFKCEQITEEEMFEILL